jgi:hypothetical protein
VFHEPPPARAGSIHTPGRSFCKVQTLVVIVTSC